MSEFPLRKSEFPGKNCLSGEILCPVFHRSTGPTAWMYMPPHSPTGRMNSRADYMDWVTT